MAFNTWCSGRRAWVRDPREFEILIMRLRLYDLVKSYGIENVQLLRTPDGTDRGLPGEGKFWSGLAANAADREDGAMPPWLPRPQSADCDRGSCFLSSPDRDQAGTLAATDKRDQYRGQNRPDVGPPRRQMSPRLSMRPASSPRFPSTARNAIFDPDQVLYGSVPTRLMQCLR